ncbi:MAG: 50S ribosomal protein L11 methyltransferase [bacterium]|nr:50S ribosomal protein L11 methyltransferase [bacterium]
MPRNLADDIAAECFDHGSCGVHTEDSGAQVRLNVYFEAPAGELQTLNAALIKGLSAAGLWPDGARVLRGDVELERDWNEAWKEFYRPVWATESIVVHPPWLPVTVAAGQMAIAIDPAMAFGTGGHESTQLALQAIEYSDCCGRRCLDIGTGSGVLSIALVRLGAQHVTAVDIDPVVVDNAKTNFRANLGAETARTRLFTGGIDCVHGEWFDVIVANIESHLLRPLLPAIAAALRPDGVALFSGLLESEGERFTEWLADAGLSVAKTWSKNNWFSCSSRAHS